MPASDKAEIPLKADKNCPTTACAGNSKWGRLAHGRNGMQELALINKTRSKWATVHATEKGTGTTFGRTTRLREATVVELSRGTGSYR
jgi:hypothetical protein